MLVYINELYKTLLQMMLQIKIVYLFLFFFIIWAIFSAESYVKESCEKGGKRGNVKDFYLVSLGWKRKMLEKNVNHGVTTSFVWERMVDKYNLCVRE